MSARGGPWHCPTCLRSVPPRVETCYCGTTREQAERAAQAAAPEEAAGARPWIPLVLVAIALGLLVSSLRRSDPAPAPPAETLPDAAAPTTLRPPPPLRGSPPSSAVQGRRRPTPVPAAPAPVGELSPVPRPSAEPEPTGDEDPKQEEDEDGDEDEIDARRREARGAFEAALGRLASKRDALNERLRAWDASCGASSSAVRPAGCVLLQEDIEGLLAEVETGLDESAQEARRNWLTPGDRRQLLESVDLDDRTWGALSRRARSALR